MYWICFFTKLNGIYSGILPQRHQDTKTIELLFIIAFLMRGTLKLMSLRLINEKTPVFNLYLSPLWVFVPWWLNSYAKCRKNFITQYLNMLQDNFGNVFKAYWFLLDWSFVYEICDVRAGYATSHWSL